MRRLQNQRTAQFLFAGHGGGASPPLRDSGIGGFSIYLGILAPAALAGMGSARAEERLGKTPTFFLHTLFDGVWAGTAVVEEGAAPEPLARLLARATQEQATVEADARFRHALMSVRQFGQAQCLAFELSLSTAGAIGIGLSPQLRVEQSGRGSGQVSFLPGAPARIRLQSSFGARDFVLQVA